MKLLDAVKDTVTLYQRRRDGLAQKDEQTAFLSFQLWALIYPFGQIYEGAIDQVEANMAQFYLDPDSQIPTSLELAAFGLLRQEGFEMIGRFKKTETGWEHSNRGVIIFEQDLGPVLVYLGYPNIL